MRKNANFYYRKMVNNFTSRYTRGVYSGHFRPNRHFLKFGEENRPQKEKNSIVKNSNFTSKCFFNYNCNFNKKYLKNQFSNEEKQNFTFGKKSFKL